MRINIRGPDGFEGWFDPDKAAEQWHAGDESLYRSPGGRWVHRTSGTYHFLTRDGAVLWLVANGFAHDAEEIDHHRPAGRPEIGNEVKVRLGGLLPAVAARRHYSRADAIRHLVWLGLRQEESA